MWLNGIDTSVNNDWCSTQWEYQSRQKIKCVYISQDTMTWPETRGTCYWSNRGPLHVRCLVIFRRFARDSRKGKLHPLADGPFCLSHLVLFRPGEMDSEIPWQTLHFPTKQLWDGINQTRPSQEVDASAARLPAKLPLLWCDRDALPVEQRPFPSDRDRSETITSVSHNAGAARHGACVEGKSAGVDNREQDFRRQAKALRELITQRNPLIGVLLGPFITTPAPVSTHLKRQFL